MTNLTGQLRTIIPYVRSLVAPLRPLSSTPWNTVLQDPDVGPVRLTGRLHEIEGADSIAIVIHGLGGTIDSYYCRRATRRFHDAGLSTLLLSLRGSDQQGEDFYNIAQTADVRAAISSPELDRYQSILVIGYSMGGYIALHHARNPGDPRVRAVAAVCTPIDLLTAQRHIDAAWAGPYRRHILNGLKSIYAAVGHRRVAPPGLPTAVDAVQQVKTIHEWDRLTIAPRYGYDSPEHYYRELSIEPHLGSLAVPSLLLASRQDPVVLPDTIEPFLGKGAPPFEVRWIDRGGHVAFPENLDLGYGPKTGLEHQLAHWFLGMA